MEETKSKERKALSSYALFCLGRKPYFRAGLKEKLFLRAEKLGFGDTGEVIEKILSDLEKSGFFNDFYLACGLVRKNLKKGWGGRIISYKLSLMGVEKELVARAMKEEMTEEIQMEAIKDFVKKKKWGDIRVIWGKLYQRGFESEIIRKVLGEIEETC